MNTQIQIQSISHQYNHEATSVEVRISWLTASPNTGYVWIHGYLEHSSPHKPFQWREVSRSHNLDRHLALLKKKRGAEETSK